jgi:MFS family permease
VAGVLTALLVLRFIIGVGEAPTFPAAAQGVSHWIPTENQDRANGIVIAAIGLGSALAPPPLTAIRARWGWRMALLLYVAAAVSVLGALLWFGISPAAARVVRPTVLPLPTAPDGQP